MNIIKFEDEQSWLDARLGKITGTRVKDIIIKRGTKQKKGFYEIIAERIAIPADQENVMDRGHRLEDEAIDRFEKETGKKVNRDLVMWQREDYEEIAISPDGTIDKENEAIEVKCLNSASHLEAFITQEIPTEYQDQGLQYFIVNENLKALYFVFYDPRMPKDFFYMTIKREDVEEKIKEYLILEKAVLDDIAMWEKQLTF